jgi:hypothetical protein
MMNRVVPFMAVLLSLSAMCLAQSPTSQPATRPANTMFDIAGAKTVVILCDASGTMLPYENQLRGTVKQCVGELAIGQAFNVLVCSGEKITPFNQGKPIAASADSVRRATAFADRIVARMDTTPVAWLRAAFAQKPDALCIITDGFDQAEHLEAVPREIALLNKDKKVKIHFLLVVDDRAVPDQRMTEMMGRIAADNGGVGRIVRKSQLPGAPPPAKPGRTPAR